MDDFWLQMRISDMDVLASHLLVKGKPKDALTSYTSSLSDALATYCSLKGADRTALFFTAAKRNVGYVLEHLGDRPVGRQHLLELFRGLSNERKHLTHRHKQILFADQCVTSFFKLKMALC
ncbi:MAG: hypothetical protein ISQ87_08045 [Rhodobacteraceae bacterium]|nr:hypothetical protein [Paracoccaceae bacterium]MBL6789829.1 hypothetical protein [Paracoccaceae bacterium]MBL6859919.1 hypothetical protein [Paracoccaceae bacterium]